jgi:Cu/Ag efflux pump CusA
VTLEALLAASISSPKKGSRVSRRTFRQYYRQCSPRYVRHDGDAQVTREVAAGNDLRKVIREMDEKLQFPGLTNTWTMPVQNRLDMALTGIKTPVGMKLQGTNLEQIQQLGAQVLQILSGLPQVRSVFAERVSQGFYINVEVNRPEAAKYGLTIADVQQAVESGIGGMNVAENVEVVIRSMFATSAISATTSES